MKKNIQSFLREEDGRTIKKSLLISSLWLITWFAMTQWADWHNNHTSKTWVNYHGSWHSNIPHASY